MSLPLEFPNLLVQDAKLHLMSILGLQIPSFSTMSTQLCSRLPVTFQT